MQASKTRMTVGTWSSLQSHALGVEDLRHEHAVGQAGRVAVAEAAGRRAAGELALDRLQAGLDPVPVPAVLGLVVDAQLALQVAQHAQVVERMDLAGDVERDRAHAGAAERVGGQERRLGTVSSRYSMIASDWVSGAVPGAASSSSAGTSCAGATERKAGASCSFFTRWTGM